MKIFHLNCGTLNPLGGKLFNRSPAKVVCHCLLVDTNNGLILIDSGLGIDDINKPDRLGLIHYPLNLRQDVNRPAVSQIQKLGYKIDDVKHIILTHLDLDHAGGLPDFPNANIHVYKPEFETAVKPASILDTVRYRQCHFAHFPKWVFHETLSDELWYGLKCINLFNDLAVRVVMIPLSGHTRGHCAIAVKTPRKWILHAGDAYYHENQMKQIPACTPGFKLFQYFAHDDRKDAFRQFRSVWDVVNKNREEITVFCSHDPSEFERLSLTKI